MSRYTVVSSPDAEDDLVSIWIDAADRRYVSEAANEADRLLARDPFRGSTELREKLRRIDIPPLRYYFVIREDDLIVEISMVVRIEG